MKSDSRHLIKYTAFILAVLAVSGFVYYIFYSIPRLTASDSGNTEHAENRSSYVLVIGKSENESFLGEIYKGANRVSRSYDAVAELHVPESQAEDVSLQSLFDYASFTNPSGIIAYIDAPEQKITLPVNAKGLPIPLITVGQYNPELTQISYIGTNYSELGRKIATESNTILGGRGSLSIVNTSSGNSPNYSTLMNSLINSLESYAGIATEISDFTPGQNPLPVEETMKKKLLSGTVDLIVCLTTEDTIRAAQIISDSGNVQKTKLIGFGEGETADMYLDKGIITELLSINPEKIGETAMQELFEYIRYGYANSYITADVRVRKAVAK